VKHIRRRGENFWSVLVHCTRYLISKISIKLLDEVLTVAYLSIFKIYKCSETTLTGESRFHISPPRGFEPVTLVAGSKQVSPLDQ
jgi:hypothetical protein